MTYFSPSTEVTTAQSLDAIAKQVAQNLVDLPAAIAANQAAGAVNGNAGASAISGASFFADSFAVNNLLIFACSSSSR